MHISLENIGPVLVGNAQLTKKSTNNFGTFRALFIDLIFETKHNEKHSLYDNHSALISSCLFSLTIKALLHLLPEF